MFQLWWVVGAVLEALRDGGLEASVSVKRLLGQADREMRRLYDAGRGALRAERRRSSCSTTCSTTSRVRRTHGPRVTAVRASFRLDELLPVDESVEQARENLSAPSRQADADGRRGDPRGPRQASRTCSTSSCARAATQVEELAPQLEMLRKIGDTLGVLGLGELRDQVQGEIESLRAIVDRASPPDDATLLGIAATLIEVEDSLDGQLVG